MNWKLRAFAGVTLAVLSLASCSFSRRSKHETIKNPSVAEMEAYESRMGIKPKAPTSPSTPINPSAGAYVPDSAPHPPAAPAPATITAPATVPLETVPPPTPPAAAPAIPSLLR